MSTLTQEQIDRVARLVIGRLQSQPAGVSSPAPAGAASSSAVSPGNGIFPTIDAAVDAAQKAHLQLMNMTLARRNEIIANIRRRMMEHAEDLAKRAHEETGLGRVADKIEKNKLVIEKTPGTEVLTPTAYSGDRGLTLMELAPYGVIGSVTPVTNPTSSIICNTIGMVAAGNAVVFNVHPGAKNVSIYNIRLLNSAITEVGGPPNLVTTIVNPTVESANELMHHPGVRLLVVTGGSGVVKAAMASGKRAICAGPGNPPVVVDESADIDQAAKNIVRGASMDNNIICVDEKEVIVVNKVADLLIAAMQRHGAVLLTRGQFMQLEPFIFSAPLQPRQQIPVNKSLIGKDVQVILSKIGMKVPKEVRLAIVEVEEDHPLLWTEQMMPVLPIVRVSSADRAIDLAREMEHGYGHTAVMYSKNLDHLSRMAREMNCSIFVKNGPSVAGLGYGGEGYCSFSIASPTGEGLTNPRSFSRERRCVLVDHFRIV